MKRIATGIVCALLAVPAAASAEKEPPAPPAPETKPEKPAELTLTKHGKETVFATVDIATTIVTSTVVKEDITLTYSPGSSVASTETIKPQGTELVLWRPKRPGVVSIVAPGHPPKNVSVRFDGTPLSGLLIMLLAGGILFGGALFSLRTLLNDS